MTPRPAVLCPIDFSEPSRAALRYGAAIAAKIPADLTVLTVNDPLLVEAFDMTAGAGRLAADAQRELERFVHDTFPGDRPAAAPAFVVSAGKPAVEILRLSARLPAGLIVMSSRGATGMRKLFFGSTAERVLRETTVPVLLTPAGDAGPGTLADIRKTVRRILVPVDLGAAIDQQVGAARAIAEAIGVPVLLVHIIEPVRAMVPGHLHTASVDNERRHRAEQQLQAMIGTLPAALRPEALVMFGEPSEEIVKIAKDRDAGLIVMGLHASPVLAPRMGSVTYRVLCLASILVLALPPGAAAAAGADA